MEKNVETRKMLISLGITPEIKGYHYMIDAIEMMHEERSEGKKFCGWCNLYREIAEKNETTATLVERNLRSAVCRAFGTDFEKVVQICGPLKKVPTISRFVSSLAEYIAIEQ